MKHLGMLILGLLVFTFASCTEEPYDHDDMYEYMHQGGHHMMMDWDEDNKIDKNEDNRISKEEWKTFNDKRFEYYDRNNNGFIDSDEYHHHFDR